MTCIINPDGTGSCSAPGGNMAGLPGPGSTTGTYDPGYLIPQPNGTSIDANGTLHIPQGILVRKTDPNAISYPPGTPGAPVTPLMEGITTGISTKSMPPKFQVQWNRGLMTNELASDLFIVGPAVIGCTDPNRENYDPNANTEGPVMIGGGNICGNLTIDAQGIEVLPGTKVDIVFGNTCGPFSDDGNCGEAMTTFTGITTGNSGHNPSNGYIIWEVKFERDGNTVTDYFLPSQMQNMVPTTTAPGVIPVEPPRLACQEDEYKVPLSKLGGEDKCIDKTLALVLGAVALYFLLAKEK